jgi:hypothetical protein
LPASSWSVEPRIQMMFGCAFEHQTMSFHFTERDNGRVAQRRAVACPLAYQAPRPQPPSLYRGNRRSS